MAALFLLIGLVVVSCGSSAISARRPAASRAFVRANATEAVSAIAGPPTLPASLIGTEWTKLPTTKRLVALTFDAGANDAGVPSILSTLAATGTSATFFLTGHWVQSYRAMAARIGERFPVGNHTWTHPDLTTLSDALVRQQVTIGAQLIEAATGRDTHPLFRFPFGARDARTIRLVNALGFGSIRWTVDTLGWMGTSGGQSTTSVEARVLSNLQPGEIVLMHVGSNPKDNSTLDASALPAVIKALTQRGYHFVTIDQFIGSLAR